MGGLELELDEDVESVLASVLVYNNKFINQFKEALVTKPYKQATSNMWAVNLGTCDWEQLLDLREPIADADILCQQNGSDVSFTRESYENINKEKEQFVQTELSFDKNWDKKIRHRAQLDFGDLRFRTLDNQIDPVKFGGVEMMTEYR